MKALLMKDLRTLKNERRLWVSIIGVSVFIWCFVSKLVFYDGIYHVWVIYDCPDNVSIRCGGPGELFIL